MTRSNSLNVVADRIVASLGFGYSISIFRKIVSYVAFKQSNTFRIFVNLNDKTITKTKINGFSYKKVFLVNDSKNTVVLDLL